MLMTRLCRGVGMYVTFLRLHARDVPLLPVAHVTRCISVVQAYQEAEMLRTPLSDLALHAKAVAPGFSIQGFLSRAVDAPPPEAVGASIARLQALSALTRNEQITPLGALLHRLPLPPEAGKVLLAGVLFGCTEPALTVACALAYQCALRLALPCCASIGDGRCCGVHEES
jgi:Helicase associated domain (HA2)